jgi:hypothetical protein
VAVAETTQVTRVFLMGLLAQVAQVAAAQVEVRSHHLMDLTALQILVVAVAVRAMVP